MSRIYIKDMKMPIACYQCWALDDDGDYPRCRITGEQHGYNFRIYEKRMDKCPLKEALIKIGHWIELDSCMTMCSECNNLGCNTNYCPNYGAYMKEVK